MQIVINFFCLRFLISGVCLECKLLLDFLFLGLLVRVGGESKTPHQIEV
jgi:hypothetical protein